MKYRWPIVCIGALVASLSGVASAHARAEPGRSFDAPVYAVPAGDHYGRPAYYEPPRAYYRQPQAYYARPSHSYGYPAYRENGRRG
ncbi:MAG TPA: hypothetical protein VGC70_14680, partial [Burkholderiales bacterium]